MASVEDIGIDLGSSNVLICERGKGIVLNEPAVLAVNHDTRNIISIGQEAYQMMGREPAGISVVRPLRRGTIQDFDMLSILLNYFVMRVVGKHLFNRPRALLSVSATANEIEKRQLILGMLEAGARRTQLLERPLAAAMGAGILINEVSGRMVADIGGATTDVYSVLEPQGEDAGLRKQDIRSAARRMGLPVADKPAAACLASRIPYGTRLTRDRLAAVERSESAVAALGFQGARVRAHGDVARIELAERDLARALSRRARAALSREIHRSGFSYVALDLDGYRTGSLNATAKRRRA